MTRPAFTIIGDCPRDGRDFDCCCGRCGSTMHFVDCDTCGGEGYDGHECGEDCCACLYPEDNVPCGTCNGAGGWFVCLSSEEWCQAHPLAGREAVERHTTEWFTFDDLDPRLVAGSVPPEHNRKPRNASGASGTI